MNNGRTGSSPSPERGKGICVVIAARNAEDTIAQSVRSALEQNPVTEVLVFDDGSDDGTIAAVKSANDGSGRLRLLHSDTSIGPAAARNAAIAESVAPFIAPLDADDVFVPGRFEGAMNPSEDWDLRADNILFVQPAHGPHRRGLPLSARQDAVRRLEFADFVRGNMAHRSRPRGELGFLKPLISRSFLVRHGLRYDESLRLGEDFDLYARMLLAGAHFSLTSACGYVAEERSNSLSARHSTADLAALVRAEDRLLQSGLTRDHAKVLRSHRNETFRKLGQRRFLDLKRSGGLGSGILYLARNLSIAPDILTAIMHDKWRTIASVRGPQLPRLLIPTPAVETGGR